VLLAILALALVMDLVFYTGFFASDDLQYLRGARQARLAGERGCAELVRAGS
jgi:hypothetical protein